MRVTEWLSGSPEESNAYDEFQRLNRSAHRGIILSPGEQEVLDTARKTARPLMIRRAATCLVVTAMAVTAAEILAADPSPSGDTGPVIQQTITTPAVGPSGNDAPPAPLGHDD